MVTVVPTGAITAWTAPATKRGRAVLGIYEYFNVRIPQTGRVLSSVRGHFQDSYFC